METLPVWRGWQKIPYRKRRWNYHAKFIIYSKFGILIYVTGKINKLLPSVYYFKGRKFRGKKVSRFRVYREIIAFRGKKLSRLIKISRSNWNKVSRKRSRFLYFDPYFIQKSAKVWAFVRFRGKNFRVWLILEGHLRKNFRKFRQKTRNRETFFLRNFLPLKYCH